MSYGGVTQTAFGAGSSGGFKLNLNNIARQFFDPQKLSAILEQVGKFVEDRARGQAPYVTGELVNSGFHQTSGMKVIVGFTAEHAAPVEFGHVTASGSFVAARPYLQPAMEDGFALLDTLIKRHAETVLSKGAGG